MTRSSIVIIFLLISSCNLYQNEKPNIILFFYDDLGYGELGVYGQKIIETNKSVLLEFLKLILLIVPFNLWG